MSCLLVAIIVSVKKRQQSDPLELIEDLSQTEANRDTLSGRVFFDQTIANSLAHINDYALRPSLDLDPECR